jgi:hypothetical protein
LEYETVCPLKEPLLYDCHLTEASQRIIRAMIEGEAKSFGWSERAVTVDPEGVEWEQADLWIRQPKGGEHDG